MNDDYSDKNPDLARLYPAHVAALCARHDHALDNSGAAHAIVFSGCPKTVFLDDQHYPYKANAHFVSWAPLTALPLSYIVYTPGETPRQSSCSLPAATVKLESSHLNQKLMKTQRSPAFTWMT